jgi:organic radical activating enzyme
MFDWITDQLLLRRLKAAIPDVNALPEPARSSLDSALRYNIEGRGLRERHFQRHGVRVPAVFSLQMLTACNLRCEGCHVSGGEVPKSFDRELHYAYLEEIEQLGCRMVLLIGGEPMILADEVFALAARFPRITFLLFTNGTLWTPERLDQLATTRNLVPMVSVEGDQSFTEERRGRMAFERSRLLQAELARRHILHGISVMVYDRNVDHLEQSGFLQNLFPSPHHFAFFMAYTARGACSSFAPVDPLRLDAFNKTAIRARESLRLPILLLPHDEMRFLEGCGGARLIVHMNADNSLALCPYTYDGVIGRPAAGKIMETLAEIQSQRGVDKSCAGLMANIPHHRKVVPIYPTVEIGVVEGRL